MFHWVLGRTFSGVASGSEFRRRWLEFCVGTFLVLEPAVFVEPMLLAIVVSPGPRWRKHTTASTALPRWGTGNKVVLSRRP